MKIKLLIIGLMISVLSYGQKDWQQHRNIRKLVIQEQYITINNYLVECYADSIEVWPGVLTSKSYHDVYDILRYYIPPGMDCETFNWYVIDNKLRYIHRQPTFEGYVKWLEQRLK